MLNASAKKLNRTIKITLFIFLLFIISGIGIYFLCTDMTLKEFRQAFLVNVFSGIFVSFIWILLLLRFLRPKFEISPFVCLRNGEYHFKIVNKSIYHAFDVNLELFCMIPYTHVNAFPSVTLGSIPLTSGYFTTINRFRKNNHPKDPFSLFALTVSTQYNLEEKIRQPGVFFELRITGRHGLTGLADRYVVRFADEKVIKENHKFEYGCNLSTIPFNQA